MKKCTKEFARKIAGFTREYYVGRYGICALPWDGKLDDLDLKSMTWNNGVHLSGSDRGVGMTLVIRIPAVDCVFIAVLDMYDREFAYLSVHLSTEESITLHIRLENFDYADLKNFKMKEENEK